MDRIRGIALVTAALSCGRGDKEKHIYSPAGANDQLKQRPRRRFKDSARPLPGKRDPTSPSDGNYNRHKGVIAVYLLSGGG